MIAVEDRSGDTPPISSPDGSLLIEVLVVILILSIIAAPLTAFIITMLRSTAAAERHATRVGVAVTAASIASRIDVGDECDGAAYAAPIGDRVGIPAGWSVTVSPDCTDDPTVLSVVVVDDRGGVTELAAVRP